GADSSSWLGLGVGGRRLPGLLGAIGGAPAPDLRALAAMDHAGAEDVGHHVAVAGQQRLGRAHFGAGRQLALGQPVAAILFELLGTAVFFRPAGAERALVHLAAHAEGPFGGELRRAERTGVRTVAAADTGVLVV